MSVYAVLSILCAIGCGVAEIASPHWVSHYRHSYNNLQPRYESGNASYVRFRHPERINHYNRHPIYRYDYALANRRRGYNPMSDPHHNSRPHRNEMRPYTTGIYRTYGRGNAVIPRVGATVSVANALPYPKVHKGTITARVVGAPAEYNEIRRNAVHRTKKHCIGCPQNRAVVASKGNSHVILPEPCPTMRWISIAGPQPGTRIQEGTHSLIGRLGYRGKICQYQYEVVVRHCGTFTVDNGKLNCTVDDVWGSICTVTCKDGYDLIGEPKLECQDDLKWSHPPPNCKRKIGCPLPQTMDDSKMWCQVPNETDLVGDTLPANTYCRFKAEGKQRVITCIDGYWVIKHIRGRRNRNARNRKFRESHDWSKSREDNAVRKALE